MIQGHPLIDLLERVYMGRKGAKLEYFNLNYNLQHSLNDFEKVYSDMEWPSVLVTVKLLFHVV